MDKDIEKLYGYIDKEIERLKPKNEKEVQKIMDRVMKEYNANPEVFLANLPAETALEKATLLLEQLDSIKSTSKQVKLLKEAIRICDYACDAYAILASLTVDSFDALGILETGIKNFEKHKGKEYFEENKGAFWGITETRPYMRCYGRLVDTLVRLGSYSNAIEKMEYMLLLCENDNMGIRYRLLNIYVLLERFDDAEKLLNIYSEETAFFLYTRAIMLYKQMKYEIAIKVLKDAYQANKHILRILLGDEEMDSDYPGYYTRGSMTEAFVYLVEARTLIESVEEFLLFLEKNEAKLIRTVKTTKKDYS